MLSKSLPEFLAKSLPEDLTDADVFGGRLVAVYGEDQAAEIVASMGKETRHAYWVNPLRRGDVPVFGEPIPALPGMWSVPRDSDITYSEEASEGRIYIQNPSSQLAVRVLDPQPHEEVLDLAAAPGSKTIAMAVAMHNSGRIGAVEPIKGRFHRLKANVERCGVTNVEFYLRDGRGVGKVVPERFDRVLLDAPCSSEARMRWSDSSTYKHWSQRKVKETQRKQKSLLRSAYAALKPGGILVYCTCSYSPEENEVVVAHLLKRSEARLETLAIIPTNSVVGLKQWQGKQLPVDMQKTIRILPNEIWDGFFIACIRKPEGEKWGQSSVPK